MGRIDPQELDTIKKSLTWGLPPEYDFPNLDLRRFQVIRLLDAALKPARSGKGGFKGESGKQHEVIRLWQKPSLAR
jgi:hypothetical protein